MTYYVLLKIWKKYGFVSYLFSCKNIIVLNLLWNYLWIPKGKVWTNECISHDYLVSSVNNNGSFSIQEIRYNCSLFDQQTIAFVTNPSLKNKDMCRYLLCNYVCTVFKMLGMAIRVVEFPNGGYKIRKIFA